MFLVENTWSLMYLKENVEKNIPKRYAAGALHIQDMLH